MSDRKHPVRGAFFGLIAGVGLALLLISHGIMIAGKLTPPIAVALMFVLGIVWGLAGPKRVKEPPDRIPRREQRLVGR